MLYVLPMLHLWHGESLLLLCTDSYVDLLAQCFASCPNILDRVGQGEESVGRSTLAAFRLYGCHPSPAVQVSPKAAFVWEDGGSYAWCGVTRSNPLRGLWPKITVLLTALGVKSRGQGFCLLAARLWPTRINVRGRYFQFFHSFVWMPSWLHFHSFFLAKFLSVLWHYALLFESMESTDAVSKSTRHEDPIEGRSTSGASSPYVQIACNGCYYRLFAFFVATFTEEGAINFAQNQSCFQKKASCPTCGSYEW